MEPLTTILTRFSRAHPDVTVNAEAAFTPEEVLTLVRTGSAEIGVLGSAEPTAPPTSTSSRWNARPWC